MQHNCVASLFSRHSCPTFLFKVQPLLAMYRPSSSHSSSFDQPSSSTRPRRAPLNINPLPPLSSFDNIPRKQSPREISHSHSNSSDWIPPIKREPTMAVANSNQRIAIPSLLNDPIREPGRPSSSTPQIKLFECEQCFKRYTGLFSPPRICPWPF